MPMYSMRTYRRASDVSSPGRLAAMWKFAAQDDTGAVIKAWSRYPAVPTGDFAVLFGEANRQVLVLDGSAKVSGPLPDLRVNRSVQLQPRR